MEVSFEVFVSCLIALLGGLLSVIWFYHRRELNDLNKRIIREEDERSKRIEAVKRRSHELASRIQAAELNMAQRYLERTVFDSFAQQIMDRLDRIYEKLDSKADKERNK